MAHTLTPLPPIPLFPPTSYLQTYLTQSRIDQAQKKVMSLALLSSPPPPPPPKLSASSWGSSPSKSKPPSTVTAPLPPLKPETYYAHFLHLLRWELDAQATQKEQIVLWKVGISVLNWDEATFVLYVPSVRGDTEFGGRVAIGDLVQLREVMEWREVRREGPNREEKEYVGGKGTGRAFEGRVTVVRKREGMVHLYSPTLKQHVQAYTPVTAATMLVDGWPVFTPQDSLPYLFNVTFLLNARPLCVMEHALSAISHLLNPEPPVQDRLLQRASPVPKDDDGLQEDDAGERSPKDVGMNLAMQWLFPEEEYLEAFPPRIKGNGTIKSTEWCDPGLNEEQKVPFVLPFLLGLRD